MSTVQGHVEELSRSWPAVRDIAKEAILPVD